MNIVLKIYADLNQKEALALSEMRDWALSQGDSSEQLIGQLDIAQRIIRNNTFTASDTWKMNAIGVLFGDALAHAMEGRLRWVIAEDELGPAYALSWKHTEALVYPLSAIRSRLEHGEPLDLHTLFAEYSSAFPFQQR